MKILMVFSIVLFLFVNSSTESFASTKGEHMLYGILLTVGTLYAGSQMLYDYEMMDKVPDEESGKYGSRSALWFFATLGLGVYAATEFDKALEPEGESAGTETNKAILNFDKNIKLTSVCLPTFSLKTYPNRLLKVTTRIIGVRF